MISLYLDTNIMVDLFVNRQPFTEAARKLLRFAEEGTVKFYCNSHSVATAHYILKKIHSESVVREKLEVLLRFLEIIGVDSDTIQKSLKSQHKDFEDAIQIFCAHQIKGLDGIVTRNLKDFSTSEIEVFSPDEALNYIQNKLN